MCTTNVPPIDARYDLTEVKEAHVCRAQKL